MAAFFAWHGLIFTFLLLLILPVNGQGIDPACRPVCRSIPREQLLDGWCPTIVADGKRDWIIVDVLMVYTRNAMCGVALGDSSTVEERMACPITDDNKEHIEKIAREMVHETNEAFCNSNMEIFLNIVGFELWDTTLEDEETPSQPSYLGDADYAVRESPEIDCMRKKYQADVVAVIIDHDLAIAEDGTMVLGVSSIYTGVLTVKQKKTGICLTSS